MASKRIRTGLCKQGTATRFFHFSPRRLRQLSSERGIPKPAVEPIEPGSINVDAGWCEKLAGFRPSAITSASQDFYEPDETIQQCPRSWHRQLKGGFARMTTYMIALAFLCLFYGFFWNNRTAKESVRLDNADSKLGPARTAHHPDGAPTD
jgi:hypothetical protein